MVGTSYFTNLFKFLLNSWSLSFYGGKISRTQIEFHTVKSVPNIKTKARFESVRNTQNIRQKTVKYNYFIPQSVHREHRGWGGEQ